MKNMKGAKRFVRNCDILSARSQTARLNLFDEDLQFTVRFTHIKFKRASSFFFCRLIKKIFISYHVPAKRSRIPTNYNHITSCSRDKFHSHIPRAASAPHVQCLITPKQAAMKFVHNLKASQLINLLIDYFSFLQRFNAILKREQRKLVCFLNSSASSLLPVESK